jgi:hypothetical protein
MIVICDILRDMMILTSSSPPPSGTEVCLLVARQVLYHLSHAPSLILTSYNAMTKEAKNMSAYQVKLKT